MNEPLVNGLLVVTVASADSCYRGPDRDPWCLVGQHYYMSLLPADVLKAYETMTTRGPRGLWWPVCHDVSAARSIAEYERMNGRAVELLAIYSPYLARQGAPTLLELSDAVFLGIDVISVGEWSLLQAIQSGQHPALDESKSMLDENGLLPDATFIDVVERIHRELAEAGILEPIAGAQSGVPVEAVEVYAFE